MHWELLKSHHFPIMADKMEFTSKQKSKIILDKVPVYLLSFTFCEIYYILKPKIKVEKANFMPPFM